MAELTGLEPATPGVTGRYSNQLNYHSACWWVLRGSNPRPSPCKGDALPAELSTPLEEARKSTVSMRFAQLLRGRSALRYAIPASRKPWVAIHGHPFDAVRLTRLRGAGLNGRPTLSARIP